MHQKLFTHSPHTISYQNNTKTRSPPTPNLNTFQRYFVDCLFLLGLPRCWLRWKALLMLFKNHPSLFITASILFALRMLEYWYPKITLKTIYDLLNTYLHEFWCHDLVEGAKRSGVDCRFRYTPWLCPCGVAFNFYEQRREVRLF